VKIERFLFINYRSDGTVYVSKGGAESMLKDLKTILKKHKLWIQSKGYEGKMAILSYSDFSGMNLSNLDFQGISLKM
jgi:acylphosphatase